MITVFQHIDVRPFNTFGISANCDQWINYSEENDIAEALRLCGNNPWLCIGGGSNMLFTGDFHGTILHSAISGISIDPHEHDAIVTIGAGVRFDNAVRQMCDAGLWGIENLSGIPGDAGAAAVQNIGAYGVEIKDVVESVRCYDTMTGDFKVMQCNECGYGYRQSLFKSSNRRYIVTEIKLRLTSVPTPRLEYAGLSHIADNTDALSPLAVRNEVLRLRDSKLPDPAIIGNAGSFFKNPVLTSAQYEEFLTAANKYEHHDIPHYITSEGMKIPAAWLIEQCGFKGCTEGNAGVWHKQPLVLINATGQASGNDIVELERHIISAVHDRFGIQLHPEVEHI